MSSYRPPELNNIPFKFSSHGYVKPSFDDVTFNFKPTTTESRNLQAAVQVLQLYQDSAYIYKKDCKQVVIGYTSSGIQTIRLTCTYAGIRDIGASVFGEIYNYDLSAHLKVVNIYSDLSSYIISGYTGFTDLEAYVKGYTTAFRDLKAIVLGKYVEVNLGSYINIISIYDLPSRIQPQLYKGSYSLTAYLKAFQANLFDLKAYLNIIQISNLPTIITPELWHGYKNLSTYIKSFSIDHKDFNVTLHSWDQIDLGGIIDQVYSYDLKARILATLNFDLSAHLYAVVPKNLNASLQGFAVKSLKSFILGDYGPTDLRATLRSTQPKDLKGFIQGYLALRDAYNLKAYISSFIEQDLLAYIYAGNVLNLKGFLNATGSYKDLRAQLIPKIIHVKKALDVCLLGLRNLSAVINTTCFSTGYKNLEAYLYSYNSKVLHAYLMVGSEQGGNLGARINKSDVIVEDTIDVLYDGFPKFVTMELNVMSKTASIAFNTIDVLFYNKLLDLKAYLVATKFKTTFTNLSATLHCELNKAYNSKYFPDKRDLKFGVYKLNQGRLDWRREIEVVFSSQARHYNYVEGTVAAYRQDKSKHWVIRVEGFNYIDGLGIEKGKVRHRYIFDLSRYATIDEAIRDAIDRVATLKKANLSSTITGVISRLPFYDLGGKLYAIKFFRSYNDFRGLIYGYSRGNTYDVMASIVGELPKFDLSAYINGAYYAPPAGDKVNFNFTQQDLLGDPTNPVNLNFKSGV